MRVSLLFACVLALAGAAPAVHAQGLTTTTEYGVTITPIDVTNGIQETQDFWGPVRKYIAGEEFKVADPEIRKQAAQFFHDVHDSLHKRLFEGDEASGQDLINYLVMRLRKFTLYRDLRKTIDNDVALLGLIERWEKAHRDLNVLDVAERPARAAALLALMPDEMKAVGVSAGAIDPAMTLWTNLSDCMAKMSTTETGKMLIGYEQKAKELDRPIGELVRQVATAADWAMITKTHDGSLSRADFEVAWKQVSEFENQRLATAPAAKVQ